MTDTLNLSSDDGDGVVGATVDVGTTVLVDAGLIECVTVLFPAGDTVLLWCFVGVMVLLWYFVGVTVLLWYFVGVTVLLWYFVGVTVLFPAGDTVLLGCFVGRMVLLWCFAGVTVLFPAGDTVLLGCFVGRMVLLWCFAGVTVLLGVFVVTIMLWRETVTVEVELCNVMLPVVASAALANTKPGKIMIMIIEFYSDDVTKMTSEIMGFIRLIGANYLGKKRLFSALNS